MRQAVSKLIVGSALALGVVVALAGPHVSAASADSAVGTVCADESVSWSGSAELGAGESIQTGVVVPVQAGEQLAIASAEVATAQGSPTGLDVSVGDVVAVAGASSLGGTISVTNGAAQSQQITAVDVVVTRCHQVASESPRVVATVSIAAESADSGTSGGLPNTGVASRGVLYAALAVTAAGLGLLVLGRRRPA